MQLRVERQPPTGDSVFGRLFVDGVLHCLTLERADTLTPMGIYPLALTVSARCTAGKLWSPDDDPIYRPNAPWSEGVHRLLLVMDVPGREGIRIHSANKASELDGCTATGQGRASDTLTTSRAALAALMNLVVPALRVGAVTIEYCAASGTTPITSSV